MIVFKTYLSYRNATHLFWERYPALGVALLFLTGIAGRFHPLYLLAGFPFLLKRNIWLICIIVMGFLMAPSLQKPGLDEGIFHIKQLKRHQGPFKTLLVYEGIFEKLPCRLYLPLTTQRPPATQDYRLSSVSLVETTPHHFIIKTTKETTWTPIENTKSSAEWRFQTKEKIRRFAKTHFPNQPVRHLLTGLLTGQNESRLQTFMFRSIGLQHLLAISGFHFALLTFFLAFLLRPLLSKKWLALTLILLLTLYFYYMGEAPSISRAWIGVLVFLGGMLLNRKSAPLNALGVGLLAALLSDPRVIFQLGFQLSFGATLGILLFYAPFEAKLQRLFPKRSFKDIQALPLLDQWGHLCSTYLRKVCSLSGAVLTFTLPLLLVHFHQFPLISLLYNLFFPLLFSLLIALLLFSLIFPFCFPLLNAYAAFLLRLVAYAPKRYFFVLRAPVFPQELALCLCLVFFIWGLYLQWSSSTMKEWRLT